MPLKAGCLGANNDSTGGAVMHSASIRINHSRWEQHTCEHCAQRRAP